MLAIGEKENRYMKKKTNKNQTRRTGLKSTASKTVKDSQVVYRTYKESIKTPSYTNVPIGKIEIVKDFLPTPEELVLKDATVKVTLNLSKTSIDFFKSIAQKNGSQYQKIIRLILDSYSSNYSK